MSLFEKFCQLPIEPHLIGLERSELSIEQFCTPRGARTIGWENNIQYCFIRGYGEMVFAVNPEGLTYKYVYPLAENFKDFLRLILACGSTTAVEQIILWTEEEFARFLISEENVALPQQLKTLEIISKELHLTPMENPYAYVKAVQSAFDDSKIHFSDDYYDTLGLPLPEGRKPKVTNHLREAVVTSTVQRQTPN